MRGLQACRSVGRMRCVLALTMIAVAIAPVAVAARPKVPAGRWAVEYAANHCILSKEGLGGDPSIAVRTRPMDEQHDLMFALAPAARIATSFKGHLDGEAADTPERWIITEQVGRVSRRWIMSSISADELASSIRAGRVGLTGPEGFAISANLPIIDRAMAALRLCEDDLAKRWRVDPAEMRQWAHPARAEGDLRELFWSEDKARVAIFDNVGVRALLDIDALGKVTMCTLLRSSRVAWADRKICEGLRTRAKFYPAIDRAGNPVAGKLVTPEFTSVLIR